MDVTRSASWMSPIKVLGVPVRVHLGWLLVAILIGWSLAMGSLPVVYAGLTSETYWAMAAIIIVGLGLSILLHEFAHTLAGRAMGISVDRITLFVFGGVAELHEEPRTAGSELGMALAGPLFSIVLCGILALAAGASQVAGAPDLVVGSLTFIATLNLVMAVFNMLPAFPLDGGRVVRAVIWMITGDLDRATRIATGLGAILSVLLMAGGLAQALRGSLEGGLWTILIGLFLQYAARSARAEADAQRILAGRPVGELMVRSVESAPAGMTLDQFVDQMLVATHHGLYPVFAGDVWMGVVEPADILRTPRERWGLVTVGEVCTPRELASVVSPGDDAAKVLDRMLREDQLRLLVVDRGAVTGVVTMGDLQARLAMERKFQPHARQGPKAANGEKWRASNARDPAHLPGSS